MGEGPALTHCLFKIDLELCIAENHLTNGSLALCNQIGLNSFRSMSPGNRVLFCDLNTPILWVKKEARAGNPAAPRRTSLPLLPLGPGGVRRVLPRRTHPSVQKHTPGAPPCQAARAPRGLAVLIAASYHPKPILPKNHNPQTQLRTASPAHSKSGNCMGGLSPRGGPGANSIRLKKRPHPFPGIHNSTQSWYDTQWDKMTQIEPISMGLTYQPANSFAGIEPICASLRPNIRVTTAPLQVSFAPFLFHQKPGFPLTNTLYNQNKCAIIASPVSPPSAPRYQYQSLNRDLLSNRTFTTNPP